MKLSIITINYNNASGLQKTISSIINQSFTEFEYLVIDGASTDESKEVINKNAKKLSYVVSEPDNGVYHAMNKGIQHATGEYLLFINSGDHLLDENVLSEIETELDGTDIVYGSIRLIENQQNSWVGVYPETLSFQHFVESSLPHPCSFIKRELFEKIGMYDETLFICSDWKFFLDAICRHNVSYRRIDKTISVFYLNGISSDQKSAAIIKKEKEEVLQQEYKMYIKLYEEVVSLRKFEKKVNESIASRLVQRLRNLKSSSRL